MPLAKLAVADPVDLDGCDLVVPAPGFRPERGGALSTAPSPELCLVSLGGIHA